MDDEPANQALDSVADETRIKRGRLSLDTELANDIGLDGIDAFEFMEKFVERFTVDTTGF